MGRLQWIALLSLGTVLDVGAADASVWHYYVKPPPVDRVTLLDCDVWQHKEKFPFIRGDGHRLPFKDGCFDSVVLGDVLEHCVNPPALLREAKRVCRQRIVATVPEEGVWERKSPKVEYEPGMWRKAVADFSRDFHLNHARYTDIADEDKFPHLRHLREFTLDSLLEFLVPMGMTLYLVHLHHQQTHFGVMLEKEEVKC